ncbi:MAG: dihydrolipoyllysine-residue acetyltransferase [Thermoanaerobaculia bacterium]|nr:dihydrolipoyllysine-residue acetyltransferase [Thermoanaerobaculia bacterium]
MAEMEVRVPDIGDFDTVDVVEVLVETGDVVDVDDSLITLESDKASMEVPAPAAGTVKELRVAEGDQVGQDAVILLLETSGAAAQQAAAEAPTETAAERAASPSAEPAEEPAPPPPPQPPAPALSGDTARAEGDLRPIDQVVDERKFSSAYASPSVRKLARELGVDLAKVTGSARGGRIVSDDVKSYVRGVLSGAAERPSSGGSGLGGFDWPQMPTIEFSKFGEVETKPLSRIRKVSARNLHRSWLHVPHVTQHEEADVTELEAFRKSLGKEAEKRGVKMTPLAFLLRAVAACLRRYPDFNSSLDPSGENLILKNYVHIGVAVDTEDGLVVPVIRDVEEKGLFELAAEVIDAAKRARAGKLTPKDFQGACFTISSLGGIGGTAFTPIVNAPEVAILGVSRNRWSPVWNDAAEGGQGAFERRLMMPLSLSYDHRVIDGASACRFTVELAALLSDFRRVLL